MDLFYVFVGLFVASLLFAFWRGGGPERAAAAMFLASWLLTMLTRLPYAARYLTVGWHTAAIDTLLFVGLLVIARRANRVWTVVVASLQFLIVLAHLARAINPHQVRFVYMVMTDTWPLVQLAILVTGTALHWRRTAINGADPSWRS